MTNQPKSRPVPSAAQVALQRRLSAVALPVGLLLLVLALVDLAGGEPSTTAYAFFPLGAAMLLMSTQRYWKRPVAVEE
ncbi:hypothetical protein [Cellulomonas sp. NPDC058312]|uniref:hypothetical protein n=1 Tax=Cellulomonas sp. NPDC058312 TaxID=3346441 RepID=UPI0036E4A567